MGSVLSARRILQQGLRWSRGKGCNFKIWGDKWWRTLTTHKVISPVQVLYRDARVSESIDPPRASKHFLCNTFCSLVTPFTKSRYSSGELWVILCPQCRIWLVMEYLLINWYHMSSVLPNEETPMLYCLVMLPIMFDLLGEIFFFISITGTRLILRSWFPS